MTVLYVIYAHILHKINIPPLKIYATGCFAYYVYRTYDDSTTALRKYRLGELNVMIKPFYSSREICIRNELDAVKFGAYNRCEDHIIASIIWPVSATLCIVPAIVLRIN